LWKEDEEIPLDIHPGEGIGVIRLGMLPAEVLAVFQEPQIYEDWMGGNLNDALLFHGLRLHFTECDSSAPLPHSTLCLIVIHQREDATFFGQPISDWTKDRALEELHRRGYVARTSENGDVVIKGKLELSFDNLHLSWVEIFRETPWERIRRWIGLK
jgi:hypothetical protein